jgi:proteasome alpha subunit
MEQDMQHQVMGYDRAATMFSPDGHILQVEYAEKTVRLGSASIGITCKEGIVIISDKRVIDSLAVLDSANKINEIDSHIMACAAGILSDARILLDREQVLAQQHRVTYDEPIDVISIVKDLSDIKQQYTQHPGVRPFGIDVMIAGIDNNPRLFVSDVTGNFIEYKASAIGENDEKIKEKLRQVYKENMTLNEAIKTALEIFREIKGKSFNIENFDAAMIKKEKKKIERLTGMQIREMLK